jgi:hypothetical protein
MNMKRLLFIVCCLALNGCERAAPATPAEEEAQVERMRGFLKDSSPRNMNEHPKVVPEFTTTFNTNKSRDKDQDAASAYPLDELTDSD